MQIAQQRLYLNADKTGLVPHGHKDVAFLYAGVGDEIPDSAAKRFGLVDGKLKAGGKPSGAKTLLGSSVLPSMVEIAPGRKVQLGHVVARAHKASGLSQDDWNGLPEAEREALLAAAVEAWKVEAVAKPARVPATGRKAMPVKEQKPAEDKEQKGGSDKSKPKPETKGTGGAAA